MHLLTQSPLLKALGWALFDSLWQMALLWLLYSLSVFIFHIAAHIRHGLALLLVSLGACWSVVTFVLAWYEPDKDHWLTNGGLNFLQTMPQGRLGQIGRLLTGDLLVSGSSIYLMIVTGLLIRYLYHYHQSRRLTRQGLSKLPSELRVFVSATSRRMGIRSVSAWLSSRIDVPLTLGHLKPVILLPVAMINHLTPVQVEAILVHELAHIRRNDYLLHLLVTVLEGLFFFNPFTRMLVCQVKNERENCCDDLVLQFRYDPHSYVSALLSLAARGQKIQPAIAATGDGDRLLLQRAKRILQQKQSRDWPGVRSLWLLLFTLLMTLMTAYGPIHPGVRRQTPSAIITPATRFLPAVVTPGAVTPPVHFRAPGMPATLPAAPTNTVITRPHRRGTSAVIIDSDNDQPENDELALISTADEEAPVPSVANSPDAPGIDAQPGENLVRGQDEAPREYSIRMTRPGGPAPGRKIQSRGTRGTPFVPSSSFSYSFTAGDSADKDEQLLYLQQSTRNEILTAMNNLHRQFEDQLKALVAQEIKASESMKLRLDLQSQKLKLQQLYLKKLSEWAKKLENTGHIRMIVYI